MNEIVEVDCTETLLVWNPTLQAHVQSSTITHVVMHLQVPATWLHGHDAPERLFEAAWQVYAQRNQLLAHPDQRTAPRYLLLSVAYRPLPEHDRAAADAPPFIFDEQGQLVDGPLPLPR